MIETNFSDKFIISLLTGDTVLAAMFDEGTVQLFGEHVPQNTVKKAIVYTMPSADDMIAMGGFRMFSNAGYMLDAVGRDTGHDAIRPIANRIDDLLDNEPSQVIDGVVYVGRFIRTNIIKRSEAYDNVWWSYYGQLYETIVYPV